MIRGGAIALFDGTAFAFTLDVHLAPPIEVGEVPGGFRRVIPITGGTFDGPMLSGEIMPGGADWNLVRPDGIVHLWARYTLKTDQGEYVMITNEGWGTQDDATMQRIFSGTFDDTDDWYCRTHPRFEAGSPRLDFLQRSVFVGTLRPPTRPDRVVVDIHQLL
jgi:hypothetical protein